MWCGKRQAASATACLKKVVPILLFNQNLDIFNCPLMDGRAIYLFKFCFMRKIYSLLLVGLLAAFSGYAQNVSSYAFSSNSSGSYSPITGGTLIKNTSTTSIDDDVYNNLDIGFTFSYAGTSTNKFSINANGYIELSTSTLSSYAPTSVRTYVVSALGTDLIGRQFVTGSTTSGSKIVTVTLGSTAGMTVGDLLTGTGIASGATITGLTSSSITMSLNATSTGTGRNIRSINCGTIRYETLGSAPNRTLVVQWSKFSRYITNQPSDNFNFQIRLSESNGAISFVYNNTYTYSTTSILPNVGLTGAAVSDFNTRSTTTSWSSTTAGANNTASCTLSSTVSPSLGLTFTWSRPSSCSSPASQPTSLLLNSLASSISGSFTAPSSTPTGYLVVRTSSSTPPTNPTNGISYVAGASDLGGVIVSTGSSTSFSSTSLSPGTPYFFWIFPYNSGSSCFGPI